MPLNLRLEACTLVYEVALVGHVPLLTELHTGRLAHQVLDHRVLFEAVVEEPPRHLAFREVGHVLAGLRLPRQVFNSLNLRISEVEGLNLHFSASKKGVQFTRRDVPGHAPQVILLTALYLSVKARPGASRFLMLSIC